MAFKIPNAAQAEDPSQAMVDSIDFDTIVAAFDATGVINGCAVTAQGTPNMTVAVAAGIIIVAGTQANVTGGNVTITTANATNPRFDLIVVNNTGVKSAVAGTPAAQPVFPAVPASSVVIAAVRVPAGATSINSQKIVDKRVTAVAPALAPGSVGTTILADNAVTTPKLADASVTGAKIVDGTITDVDVAAANKDGAVGTPSLRTLGTGAQQAAAGNDARLSDTRTPTDNTVSTAKLQNAAVTGAKIAADTIDATNIAPSGVGNSELAANSVDTTKIVDGTIQAGDLAAGAALGNIAADSIDATKIAPNAIGASELADG